MKKKQHIMLFAVLLLTAGQLSGTESIKLQFDIATGKTVVHASTHEFHALPPTIALEREDAVPIALPYISGSRNPETGELTRVYRRDGLTISEIIRLHGQTVSRSIRIAADSENGTRGPHRLFYLQYPWALPENGRYLLPAAESGDGAIYNWEYSGPLSQIGNSTLRHSNYGFGILLTEFNGLSAMFIAEGRSDRCRAELKRIGNAPTVLQRIDATGYLEKEIAQEIPRADLVLAENSLADALKTMPARWFRENGYAPPADRPTYLHDLILFCCHPGGTARSRISDLGGLQNAIKVLPELAGQVGANAIYLLPVQDEQDTFSYSPRNYFKLDHRWGNPEEYRHFLAACHRKNFRVIQDIIPHGGTPAFGKLRGNSPFDLVINQNGRPANYWCFDFGDHSWQNYLRRVAGFWMKKYPLDGFRIDAVSGNQTCNWRRPGFPSRAPDNIDVTWWNKALQKNGGIVPPLDYPRAGMGLRRGGLEMCRAIREEVRKARPESGFTLAEVRSSVYMTEADIIYDLSFSEYTLNLLMERNIEDFSRGISARFSEQYHTDIPETLRLRHIDSHDTQNLRGLLGLPAWKALHSLLAALPGVPMILHGSERLQLPWLAKLMEVRRKIPALRRGTTEFSAIGNLPGEIFSIYRQYEKQAAVLLVNFSGQQLSMSPVYPAAAIACGTPYDLLEGRRAETLTLAPWQSAIVVFGETPDISPYYFKQTSTDKPSSMGSIKITEQSDLLLVETPCYTARLRLADGMLEQVERQGKPLCGTTAWSTDRTTAIQLATNSLRKGNSVSCTAGKLCWTWRFSPQGIRLELDSTRLKAPELSLIVPVPEASRYQARCAEGYLDDCFTAWPRTGTDNPENDLFNILSYRLPGGNILCDFELFPLHPAKPRIAVQNSAGITEFLFRDLLKQTPANIRLLDRFNATPGWALQIALREKRCPLLEPLPVFPAGKIKLDLNFSTGNLQASPEQRHPLSLFNGKIKLDHNGMDWEITGPFGKVLLRRNNGLIRSWYGSDNKLLFRRELLGTTRFHSRRALASASAAYDTEGGTHLAIRDGKLLLAFSGMLMNRSRFRPWHEPIWVRNEYLFSPDGTIERSVSFLPTITVAEGNWNFLSRILPAPDSRIDWNANSFSISRKGNKILTGTISALTEKNLFQIHPERQEWGWFGKRPQQFRPGMEYRVRICCKTSAAR